MKYVGKQNIKKFCNFYVSDLHFSVMMLPYISKQIDENVEITTIFENTKMASIETVLDKLNIRNKDKILNINWFNNNCTDEEILYSINKSVEKNNKNVFIISGNENYILKINDLIEKDISEKSNRIGSKADIKIVNCYNLEEIGQKIKSIIKNYDGLINTSGEFGYEDIKNGIV